jgi:curved DNA-binding protein CbpA
MVSPVKSRLTHYDNLGLTPAATPDEIAEAFAEQIHITITSPEEAIEHADKVYIAYETLRDPIKRRAYDAAIGLWEGEAATEQEVEPFIGTTGGESPEHLHSAFPADTPAPAKRDRRQARRSKKAAIEWPVPKSKSLDERHVDREAPAPARKDRRQARRGSKAASDRQASGGTFGPAKSHRRTRRPAKKASLEALDAAAVQRKSATESGARHDPIKKQLRPKAEGADQTRSVPASHQASTRRVFPAAGAGVIIAALGMVTLIVALVRGNNDYAPNAPSRQIATTDEQPSTNARTNATAAGEHALQVDRTQSELGGQANSSSFVGKPVEHVNDVLQRGLRTSGTEFKQNASRRAEAIPPQQSSTGQAAVTHPQKVELANRQPARTPPQQVEVANPQPGLAPPQQAFNQQISAAAQAKLTTPEVVNGQVARSATAEKICKHLPSSWTRLPQRACLTEVEWKQVEEDLR